MMLYAPGFATLPVGYKGAPGSYAGTSIATAFVANLISEGLSKRPQTTLAEILRAIEDRR